MMYYGPGIGGFGMALMIVGNLIFWGLLITVRCHCRRCAALASAARYLPCWMGQCHTPAQNWPPG
jgi:hypothetical protein